jgi:hypothetical protein
MTLYNFSYILNGDSSKHVVFALCEGLHIPTAVKSEYIYIVCIKKIQTSVTNKQTNTAVECPVIEVTAWAGLTVNIK